MRHLKNRKGLTLVELVVTIGILAFAIIPISSLFITSAKANTMSKTELDASTLAQSLMEKVKSKDTIENLINGDLRFSLSDDEKSYNCTGSQGKFDYTITIKPNQKYFKNENYNGGSIVKYYFILYDVEINIERDNETIICMKGTKLFNK